LAASTRRTSGYWSTTSAPQHHLAAASTRSSLSLATRLPLPRQSARRPSRTLLPRHASLPCTTTLMFARVSFWNLLN